LFVTVTEFEINFPYTYGISIAYFQCAGRPWHWRV